MDPTCGPVGPMLSQWHAEDNYHFKKQHHIPWLPRNLRYITYIMHAWITSEWMSITVLHGVCMSCKGFWKGNGSKCCWMQAWLNKCNSMILLEKVYMLIANIIRWSNMYLKLCNVMDVVYPFSFLFCSQGLSSFLLRVYWNKFWYIPNWNKVQINK